MEFGALKRAVRSLRRSPGFVVVAVLSLGVALGLTTATFAIVNGTLYRKVQFADPARLFTINLRYGNQHTGPSVAEQARVMRSVPAFQDVAVTHGEWMVIKAGGVPKRTLISYTTSNAFSMAGVRLRMGRYPIPSEVAAGRAVVVSSNLWTEMFANRDAIANATIDLNGHVYSIVGVWPTGYVGAASGDITIPFASDGDVERLRRGAVSVKLRPGYDSLSVKPQVAAVAAGLTAKYVAATSASPPYRIDLDSWVPPPPRLRDNVFELLLMAIAFGVLLIGCTNVTALGLARGLTRRRDYALRIALGASRGSIAGDVLAETAIIAVIGIAIGGAATLVVVGLLTHMVPEDLARWGMYIPALSGRVFAWSALALGVGMLVAGGVPAWRASRVSPADPLKDHAGTTTGRTRNEFRILVISELAVAMVLLMLTSLVTLSTRNIIDFDFGFDQSRVMSVVPVIPYGGPDSTILDALRVENRVIQRLQTIPGVASAALSGGGSFDGRSIATDTRGDVLLPEARMYMIAGPRYFETTGISLVQGRDVSQGDADGKGAVVLSQTAAKLLFPRGGALGHMIKLGEVRSARPWIPVVGVAKDVYLGPSDDPDALLNVYAQPPPESTPHGMVSPMVGGLSIVARAAHPSATLVHTIENDVQDVLPAASAVEVTPWTNYQAARVRENRFFERLLSMLSFSSLILGSLGLFSVMSYSVGQRMREFAVRQALGATPRNIVRVVLTGAFEMALGGTAVGALLSFWASSGISAQLFAVKNTDPVSLVIAEATLLVVALVASMVPAVRAMRADPVEVLRST